MGTLLAIISIILSLFAYPIGLLISLIKNLYKRQWRSGFANFDSQMQDIAIAIDATGNVVCEDFFNAIMIKKSGYKFGNRKETVSSVLGKNERDNTLIIPGRLLAWTLNTIEKNHCKISIDDNI